MDRTIKRLLITTANESTWPSDVNEPVLFLGDWCCLYSRKKLWQNLDFEIVPYHWDNRKKLRDDYKYLTDVYEQILVKLTDKLNKIHGTSFRLSYWRILIGPWLGYFVQIIFDRWYMLKYAFEHCEIKKICVLIELLIFFCK